MYATVQDLADRVGWDVLSELARGEIGPGDDSSAAHRKVVSAIETASNLVDSYLQSRYPVPIKPIPQVVRDKTVDIALYQLASWRGLNTEEQGELLVANYKAAEAWLRDVAKGVVSLGSAPAPQLPGTIELTSKPRIFSRDKLRGW